MHPRPKFQPGFALAVQADPCRPIVAWCLPRCPAESRNSHCRNGRIVKDHPPASLEASRNSIPEYECYIKMLYKLSILYFLSFTAVESG